MKHRLVQIVLGLTSICLAVYLGFGLAKIAQQRGLSVTLMEPASAGSGCYEDVGHHLTAEQSGQAGFPCWQAHDHTAYWWPDWIVNENQGTNTAVSHYLPADLALAAVGCIMVFALGRRLL